MSLLRRLSREARPGAILLRVLLVTLLALVGGIVAEAVRAHRLQTRVLDEALGEFAGFATWRFVSALEEKLYIANMARLAVAGAPLAGDPRRALPPADELRRARDRLVECRCAWVAPTTLHFRVERGGGAAQVASGETASTALRRWLADTVLADGAVDSLHPLAFRTIHAAPPGGRPVAIVYHAAPGADGHAEVAVGFVAPLDTYLAELGGAIYADVELLPGSLTRRARPTELLSVAVSAPDGTPLYRSAATFAGPYRATSVISPSFGALRVALTLNPERAPSLVASGATRTRIRFLLAALGVTGLLVAVALAQVRREGQLARLRADFTSSVSHELRTPLAQILLFGETLRSERARSEGERQLAANVIVREARRLIHMVENVLHFARSERRLASVRPQPLDLGGFVEDTVQTFAPLAASSGVRWRVALQDGLVAFVDRDALRQILLNLLDNAVKYGPVGQTIGVRVVREGARVRLSVEDEGPGVPEHERERVWSAFYRAERDLVTEVTGSGIGLSVVNELVLMQQGRRWIEGAPGGGARVVVEFPAPTADELARHDEALDEVPDDEGPDDEPGDPRHEGGRGAGERGAAGASPRG